MMNEVCNINERVGSGSEDYADKENGHRLVLDLKRVKL